MSIQIMLFETLFVFFLHHGKRFVINVCFHQFMMAVWTDRRFFVNCLRIPALAARTYVYLPLFHKKTSLFLCIPRFKMSISG